jgi:hypothetical protein
MTKKVDEKADKPDEKAESKTEKLSSENAGQEFSLKIVIDRVEDDIATLVLYDDDAVKFNLPAKFLPEGTKGGDHFQLLFKKDEQSRKQMKQEVENLLGDLLGQK